MCSVDKPEREKDLCFVFISPNYVCSFFFFLIIFFNLHLYFQVRQKKEKKKRENPEILNK